MSNFFIGLFCFIFCSLPTMSSELLEIVSKKTTYSFYDLGKLDLVVDSSAVSDDGSTIVITKKHEQLNENFSSTFETTILMAGKDSYNTIDLKNFYATDVSANGSYVVGYHEVSDRSKRGFLWRKEENRYSIDYLGDLPVGIKPNGEPTFKPHVVRNKNESFDEVVAFYTRFDGLFGGGARAYRYDRKVNLTERVEDILSSHKILPTGWILRGVSCVSRSGDLVIGTGNHNQQTKLWIARIPRFHELHHTA